MNQQNGTRPSRGLGVILPLALVSLILFRGIVSSILAGRANMWMFVDFYLFSVPLDIMIRRNF